MTAPTLSCSFCGEKRTHVAMRERGAWLLRIGVEGADTAPTICAPCVGVCAFALDESPRQETVDIGSDGKACSFCGVVSAARFFAGKGDSFACIECLRGAEQMFRKTDQAPELSREIEELTTAIEDLERELDPPPRA